MFYRTQLFLVLFISLHALPTMAVSDAQAFARDYELFASGMLSQKSMDEKARDYCRRHSNLYIAVVWPKAMSKLPGMRNILQDFAPIIYEKPFTITSGDSMVLLYQAAQLGMEWHKAQNKIYNYYINQAVFHHGWGHCMDIMSPPYPMYVFLFQTDKSLADVIACKNEIRNYAELSYYSIHVTDHWHELVALSRIVFNDWALQEIGKTENIEVLWDRIDDHERLLELQKHKGAL